VVVTFSPIWEGEADLDHFQQRGPIGMSAGDEAKYRKLFQAARLICILGAITFGIGLFVSVLAVFALVKAGPNALIVAGVGLGLDLAGGLWIGLGYGLSALRDIAINSWHWRQSQQ
jgi:hypothetical protein